MNIDETIKQQQEYIKNLDFDNCTKHNVICHKCTRLYMACDCNKELKEMYITAKKLKYFSRKYIEDTEKYKLSKDWQELKQTYIDIIKELKQKLGAN